jgi:hypothetical protein
MNVYLSMGRNDRKVRVCSLLFLMFLRIDSTNDRVLEILIRMRSCCRFTISMRGRLTLSRIWEFMSRMMGCSAILALSLRIWVNSIRVLRCEWGWSVLIISHYFLIAVGKGGRNSHSKIHSPYCTLPKGT